MLKSKYGLTLGLESVLSIPLASLVVKQLDPTLIKSLLLRARGFLMRKSQKLERKWTYCFYYIEEIWNYVSTHAKASKTFSYNRLRSARPIKKLFERSYFDSITLNTQV